MTATDSHDRPTLRPSPTPGDEVGWVATHLAAVVRGPVRASGSHRGTQRSADAALAQLDLHGYARQRNEVAPRHRRGATGLSPWIRHGLLPLPRVWAAARGPHDDVSKFRDELLWQEYARHLYARLGSRLGEPLRARPAQMAAHGAAWDRSMACIDSVLDELHTDGWIVNQTRMWLASHWCVRSGGDWRDGEDEFFAHLLDGSRAANRTGWQWTAGLGTGRVYGFSRAQVERRAPGMCAGCAHRDQCPIQEWPSDPPLETVTDDPRLRHDPDPARTAGPADVQHTDTPDAVWLTAESLGDDDPALTAHPDLPVVFVFDEPLLARLRLAGPRLVFLTERLAELAASRPTEVHVGDPVVALSGRRAATTFAPVPGWRRLSRTIAPVEVHPWPWLRRPTTGSLRSFSAWRDTDGRRSAPPRARGRRS